MKKTPRYVVVAPCLLETLRTKTNAATTLKNRNTKNETEKVANSKKRLVNHSYHCVGVVVGGG